MANSSPLLAQVALDGTLGPAGPLNGPAYEIPASLGRQVGPNLFHSFSRFNLASGESATFTGPTDVRNVLSRVTGGEPSSINGLVRSTIPGADFYFLNPSGVLFGPDARIEVGGAFVASTAVRLDLEDGGRFEAAEPERSVLTVAPPSAFGFLKAGTIGVDGARLETGPGQNLALAGGDLAIHDATLSAPGGRIDLVAAGSASELTLPRNVAPGLAPGSGGEIRVSGVSTVDASGGPGGQVRIRGGRLVMEGVHVLSGPRIIANGDRNQLAVDANLTDGVRLTAGSQILSTASDTEAGGGIRIEAPSVELNGRSSVRSETSGAAAGGDLVISAEQVRLRDDGALFTVTSGTGSGGELHLTAETIELDHGGKVLSGVESPGLGKGGDIHVQAGTLRVTGNSEMVAYTDSDGPGGDLNIEAALVEISGVVENGHLQTESVVGTTAGYRPVPIAAPLGTGSGGDLRVRADMINLADGGLLRAKSGHSGQGGDVFITAEAIHLSSTAPSSTGIRVEGRRLRADPRDPREYYNSTGSLRLQAGTLTIDGGAEVSLLHWSSGGSAGTLSIQADRIDVRGLPGALPTIYPGYQIYTMFWELYAGDHVAGGAAHIQAREVHLSHGARIGSFYRAQNLLPRSSLAPGGTGAPLTIEAERVTVAGPNTAILSYVTSAPLLESQGGELRVAADEIRVEGGGTIATLADSTEALGLLVAPHAGTLRIEANQLTVNGYAGTIGEADYAPSRIISRHPPGNSSNSGDMWVQAREIDLSRGGEIAVQGTYVPGRPAGLTIMADIIRMDDRARIWTSGQVGYGLHIRAADSLFLSGDSRIVAQTFTTTDSDVLHRIQIEAARIVMTGTGSGIYPISRYDFGGIDRRSSEGDLQIRTQNLRIQDGAMIDSRAQSTTVEGGIIVIQGQDGGQADRVHISGPGSGIFTGTSDSESEVFAPEAGRITIRARRLVITDRAAVTTTAAGRLGGGDIVLDGGVVEVSRGALISSEAFGRGFGGNITLNAGQVRIAGRSRLTATSFSPAEGAGSAGDIHIRTTGALIVQEDSDIVTETHLGRGGNIRIDSAHVVMNESRLSASAALGTGGSVQVLARGILQFESILSASSGIGLPGLVAVLAPDLDLTGTITPLVVALVEGETYLPEHCARKLMGPVSSFVVPGQGGVPTDSQRWQPSYSSLRAMPVASTLAVLDGPEAEPSPGTAAVSAIEP